MTLSPPIYLFLCLSVFHWFSHLCTVCPKCRGYDTLWSTASRLISEPRQLADITYFLCKRYSFIFSSHPSIHSFHATYLGLCRGDCKLNRKKADVLLSSHVLLLLQVYPQVFPALMGYVFPPVRPALPRGCLRVGHVQNDLA